MSEKSLVPRSSADLLPADQCSNPLLRRVSEEVLAYAHQADLRGLQVNIWDELLLLARRITNPNWRLLVRAKIATARMDPKLLSEALVAARTNGSVLGISAIVELAAVQGDNELFHEALDEVRFIETAWMRAELLAKLAAADGSPPTFLEATRAAREIEEVGDLHGAIRAIAKELAAANFFSEVNDFFVCEEDDGQPNNADRVDTASEAFADPVKECNRSAKMLIFNELIGLAHDIEDTFFRAEALAEVGDALCQAEFFDEALHVAQMLEDLGWCETALVRVPSWLERSGLHLAALEFAHGIDDTDLSIQALAKLAVTRCDSELCSQTAPRTQLLNDPKDRARVLSELAKVQSHRHLFVEALESASRIECSKDRAMAVGFIAERQASAGRLSESLTTLKKIEVESVLAASLLRAAPHFGLVR